MATFSKGYPYLVQLVGYNVYRSVEWIVESGDGVCLPVEVTQEMVSAAKEAAYGSYAAKILSMLFENLGLSLSSMNSSNHQNKFPSKTMSNSPENRCLCAQVMAW